MLQTDDLNLDLDTLLEAIDRLETTFALYDKDFRLIFANKAAHAAWPALYDGLDQGLSQWDAVRAEIALQLPKSSDREVDMYTEYTIGIVRSGKVGEITGRDGQVFRTLHESLGERGIVGIGVDLTNFRRNQEKLEALVDENFRLANVDELTGLSNRRHFIAETDSRISDQSAGFTLGILDLDGFKLVNDAFGHPIGDKLLEEAAERIRSVIGEGRLVARLGGDEFAFLLGGQAGQDSVEATAKALCDAIAKPFVFDEEQVQVTASIGMASFPDAAEDRSTLMSRADFALYHAKQAGKSQAVVFSDIHEARIQRQAKLELALREANLEQELRVEFQPVFDAADGSVFCVEALARWDSPSLGSVSPKTFLAMAENSGMINSLSLILLSKALASAKTWPGETPLAFNLSSREVTARSHVDDLLDTINESGVDPSRVILEVTETALLEDNDAVVQALGGLRRQGIWIALDDFGSGYSSLKSITGMPLDIVKIDHSFLYDVEPGPKSVAVLKSICELCQTLGIQSVVEGVESETQIHELRKAGANFSQGFLLSAPMSADAMSDYLESGSRAEALTN